MIPTLLPAAEPMASRRANPNSALDRHATMQPGRHAIRFGETSITWRELQVRVQGLATSLVDRGIGSGDRVAILMGNRPEFVEVVLAAHRIGAIAVPLNFRLTAPEVAFILGDSGASILFVDQFGTRLLASDQARVVPEITVVSTDLASGVGSVPYESMIGVTVDTPTGPILTEASPAMIMYTSGTTGRPKGAVLTYGNLQAQALTVIQAFRYEDEREVNLVASPLFHIGALGTVIPTINVGGTLVIVPTGAFDPVQTLDLLESEKITSVFLVPTQWQGLCDEPSAAGRALPDLRVLGWGAAPATSTLLESMAETFPHAMHVALFGQTEMSPITCVLHHHDALQKLGSVGRPIAAVSIRVVNAQMEDVAAGEVGEILYRGPGLMAGYWNNESATAEAFADGWFHSGDLVRMDGDGYVYVVDRVKDMIISGGENIYCAEVENVLAAHPDIADVSVVGQPHPTWGETPVACIVLRPGAPAPSVSELRHWASDSLAKYKLPTRLEVMAALPRNASGKVVKPELRARVAGS